MIALVFTIDYEIYGDGTGDLSALVHEPAERLYEIFRKWQSKFVTFVEVAELEKIERFGTDRAIDRVKRQVAKFHREGFELGLHLHPQWCNAEFRNGTWDLDYSEYNLCKLSRSRITEIVDSSLSYLRMLAGQPNFTPLSFRAGNWLFQPSAKPAGVLYDHGIRIDSSVFKGGLQRQHGLDYRPAPKDLHYWRFQDDVLKPIADGAWIEFPIHTRMVHSWRMATGKRLEISHAAKARPRPIRHRVSRMLDLMRFRYPLKLDFCRMTLAEIMTTMEAIIEEDRRDHESFRPVVAIGHTKDLIDFEMIEQFLSFLHSAQIGVTTFSEIFDKDLACA